jgi:hypothetical protein
VVAATLAGPLGRNGRLIASVSAANRQLRCASQATLMEDVVPPEQCPECRRFLKRELVAGLSAAPAACPGCAVQLTAAMFATAAADDDHSVRPPDLTPEEVGAQPRDVLAGWDIGAGPDEVASWREDHRPFPLDTVLVVGAGVAGLVAGALLDPRHRTRSAAVGAGVGVAVVAVARRLWRLEAP